MQGNADEVESISGWLGVGIAHHNRPVHRFPEIMANYFDTLSREDQERLIRGSSTFVFHNFKLFGIRSERFGGVYKNVKAESYGHSVDRDVIQSNIGELLIKTLQYSSGDIDKARNLLKQSRTLSGQKVGSYLFRAFYLFEGIEKEEVNSDVRRFINTDENVAVLALWVDSDLGNLSAKKGTFIQLLENFQLMSDSIKEQVAKLILEELLSGEVPRSRHRDIRLFITQNQESLTEGDGSTRKTGETLKAIQKTLDLENLLERVNKQFGLEDDIVGIIEEYPMLADHISFEQLEDMIDKTKDHLMASKIKKIIDSKKAGSSYRFDNQS